MITELRVWREQGGLTQREAARLLDVSQAYFSLLERGARPMTGELRQRLGVVRNAREKPERAEGVEQGFSDDLRETRALLGTLSPEKLSLVRQLLEIVAEG